MTPKKLLKITFQEAWVNFDSVLESGRIRAKVEADGNTYEAIADIQNINEDQTAITVRGVPNHIMGNVALAIQDEWLQILERHLPLTKSTATDLN